MPHTSLTPTPQHTLFHAFCRYPGTNFEIQREGEEVVLIVRAHPLTQLPWLFVAVVLFFLPPLVQLSLSAFLNIQQLLFMVLFCYFAASTYAFLNALMWIFNVGIVTTERVIDVDYKNLLQKELSESSNNDIADVTSKITGFIPSFFDYGSIYLQTAGSAQNIEYLNIPHPNLVATEISRLAHDAHELDPGNN
jgi:hypothetical protein